MAYFPAVVALGKEGELNVPLWVAFLTLPIGLLFSLCAAITWKSQMRHYQSAGH
ncbi:ABC-2 family transporter protein [Streptomyces globisporus]|uniref:ABC-2 family transporter protein n=1 Tax=Streptomyces globisporus TaxID=1908 RepID=UPI003460999E